MNEDYAPLQLSALHRFAAMLIDQISMSMVVALFFIPAALHLGPQVAVEEGEIGAGGIGWLQLLGFALYFCKDVFNGRSLAKRMLKLQVLDVKTDEPADPVKTVVRNFLCFVWPIEVIAIIINPSRRMGDWLAGTRVVKMDSKNTEHEISYLRIGLAFMAALAFVLLLAWLFWLGLS